MTVFVTPGRRIDAETGTKVRVVTDNTGVPERKRERERFSITLSGRTAAMFEELKGLTDADTDSEVFRNALRLHYMVVKAHEKGFGFYMKDPESGTIHPVLLGTDMAS